MSLSTNLVREKDIRNFLNAKPGIQDMELPVNTVLVAEGTITQAQILDMADTVVELIPAPGAGLALQFLGGVFIATARTTAYVAANDDNMTLKYTDASGLAVSGVIESDRVLEGTTRRIEEIFPLAAQTASLTQNAPIIVDNVGADVTGGSADATVSYSLRYRIVG